ncbi:MAG: hypothetical protein EHM79_04795 [Geobacter sp.]|nr:MAG: hypothetical protein EHM79_04795 [Geobacter sp.]
MSSIVYLTLAIFTSQYGEDALQWSAKTLCHPTRGEGTVRCTGTSYAIYVVGTTAAGKLPVKKTIEQVRCHS